MNAARASSSSCPWSALYAACAAIPLAWHFRSSNRPGSQSEHLPRSLSSPGPRSSSVICSSSGSCPYDPAGASPCRYSRRAQPQPSRAWRTHHGPFGQLPLIWPHDVRDNDLVLLTITTTRAPATDLGYLLHKHPGRLQTFATAAGAAHVFYPEATAERCTAALLLEVDPVALVRGAPGRQNRPSDAELAEYVNDRPYAASSMLAVALKEAFRTALTGRCDARPALAQDKIPLEIHVPALRCRGGQDLARTFFEPLGWTVAAESRPLTPEEWGPSAYLDLWLAGEVRLADALNHLYVLLPVLDDAKHYWVSTDEVDKLIRAGGDWLAGHPARDLIARRYLSHRTKLTRSALARLAEADDTEPETLDNAVTEDDEPRQPL